MHLLASILRTLVPLLVGWVVTVTEALGIEVDSVAVASGVMAAVTAAYYLLLRLAEQLAERLEWTPLRLAAGCAPGLGPTAVLRGAAARGDHARGPPR
ncbi:hypothetical protein BJP40_09555 [Streptomyces sp. CC53]|uniref:hypothetical protein n=1 Tax=Streptomyces sp. CC53 TaxID=1906740 RepID=UPI0008DD3650|nr:hypothetical protein [Streptomyces sp. CC53]OII60596.1 hypothetical protein BJP40_09555 [Streptomyces sp. CC53]